MRRKFTDFGMDIVAGSPSELAATISRELPQWSKLIRQAGIKAAD
jgi:hypothetical protein